jgi:hypothetical protein
MTEISGEDILEMVRNHRAKQPRYWSVRLSLVEVPVTVRFWTDPSVELTEEQAGQIAIRLLVTSKEADFTVENVIRTRTPHRWIA